MIGAHRVKVSVGVAVFNPISLKLLLRLPQRHDETAFLANLDATGRVGAWLAPKMIPRGARRRERLAAMEACPTMRRHGIGVWPWHGIQRALR